MGRRPSLITAISRSIEAAESKRKRQQNENKVNYALSNKNLGPKEKESTYKINACYFNEDTKVCNIEFTQSTQYRTIERYITRDYVKYPIYSEWKTKTKNIKKSIKLTNENLESLQNNSDSLIASFATEIIDKINNKNYYPLWYKKNLITLEYSKKMEPYKNLKGFYNQKANDYLRLITETKKYCESNLLKIKNNLKNNKNLELKYKKIIDKIVSSSKPLILKIITLGIYSIMVSKKRYDKCLFKYNYYKKLNLDNINDITNLEGIISLYDKQKEQIESLRTQSISYLANKIESLEVECREMIELLKLANKR